MRRSPLPHSSVGTPQKVRETEAPLPRSTLPLLGGAEGSEAMRRGPLRYPQGEQPSGDPSRYHSTSVSARTAGNGQLTRRAKSFMRANADIMLITAAGLALRLSWLLIATPMPISDWHVFKQLAFALLDHGQLGYPDRSTFHLPGQPVYLALWAAVSRSDAWLSLGTITLSTATIPLVFAAGRRILHERAPALIAAGLFAVMPLFVFFSPVLATEHLFVVLVLTSMLLLLGRDGDVSPRIAALAGLVLALATLTRGEGIFYIPAVLFFIWVGSKSGTRAGALRASAALLLAVSITLAPWYLRNAFAAEADTGLSASAGVNFYFAHNDSGVYGWYPEGQPFEGMSNEDASDLAWQLAFDYLRENPLRLFENVRFGTVQLVSDPDYALFWSTYFVPGNGDRNDPASFVQRDLPGLRTLDAALWIGSILLIVLGGLSVLAVRLWTRELWTLVLPLIGSVWVLRTIIYWAKPRYGYTAGVMLVFLAALVIWVLVARGRTPLDLIEDP